MIIILLIIVNNAFTHSAHYVVNCYIVTSITLL